MAGERIIGKKVVDFASRLNARNVDRAAEASAADIGAVVPGAADYSRFIDGQALRETVEEFDEMPETGAIATFRHDTIGELVNGRHSREVDDGYKFNVTTAIDEIRERADSGDIMWDSPFQFNVTWDESLNMVVEVSDEEMQSLEAAFKYLSVNGPSADARAPVAFNFDAGPWDFEGFEDGEWAHSGRILFRDKEGNTLLEKTVDDFDFPFAQDLRARRDPERTAEWIKGWTARETRNNTSYQPLGQPGPRDAMIDQVFETDEDVIDFPQSFAANEADDDIFDADTMDRMFRDELTERGYLLEEDFEAEEARAFLRRITDKNPVPYAEFEEASRSGLINIPPPYKHKTVLSAEEIDEAGRNIVSKQLIGDDEASTNIISFKAMPGVSGQARGNQGLPVADLQLQVDKRTIDGTETVVGAVTWARAHPSAAGKGLGLRMYGAVVDWAKKNNAQLVSDDSVSGDAVRMYEAMVRRGAQIEDQRITNPENVLVHFEEWNPGALSPQYETLDGSPLIRVTKLPEKLPAIMLPVTPLSFQEQQFVENSPYQRILYDVDGDNPYLFRGRQPFKVSVPKGAAPSEIATSMLGYNGFKERERRDLKIVASGQHGEGAEQVLYDVLARTGFDHILHAPDRQITYWDDKLALTRKQEEQGSK